MIFGIFKFINCNYIYFFLLWSVWLTKPVPCCHSSSSWMYGLHSCVSDTLSFVFYNTQYTWQWSEACDLAKQVPHILPSSTLLTIVKGGLCDLMTVWNAACQQKQLFVKPCACCVTPFQGKWTNVYLPQIRIWWWLKVTYRQVHRGEPVSFSGVTHRSRNDSKRVASLLHPLPEAWVMGYGSCKPERQYIVCR